VEGGVLCSVGECRGGGAGLLLLKIAQSLDAPCGVECWSTPPSMARISSMFLAFSLLLAATSAQPSCSAASFPVSLPDLQFFSLSPYAPALSDVDCVAACCSLGNASCSVWQWCIPGSPCDPPQYGVRCWLGHPAGSGSSEIWQPSLGWIGGLRGVQPTTGKYYAIAPVSMSTGLPYNIAVRHCQGAISADPYMGPGNGDFEWRVTEAIDQDPQAISLQVRQEEGGRGRGAELS